MSGLLVVAQSDFFRNRTGGGCVSDNGFCPDWIIHNLDRYKDPFFEHIYISAIPIVLGFAIALTLGLIAHRKRWLIGPLTGITGTLYTIPSPALLLLLLPLTGRGDDTAIVALTAYTQVIIFRNVITGLQGVPADIVDSAAGMGMTSRQRLFKVEIPLALPEILAGLRIAAATTVGLAAFAYLAGAGGLGRQIHLDIEFKSNVVVAGVLVTLLAAAFDLLVLLVQRALTPWRRAAAA